MRVDDSNLNLCCGHDPGPLQELADGLLAGESRRATEERLLACRDCRQFFVAVESLFAALGALPFEPAPPDFQAGVMRKVSKPGLGFRRTAVLSVCSLLLMIGIGLALFPSDFSADDDPAGDQVAEPQLVISFIDPVTLAAEADVAAVTGLCMALGACGYLLTRLTRSPEV